MFKKITKEYNSNFKEIIERYGYDVLNEFSNELYQAYCKRFSTVDYLTGVEWILRHYQASKKITLSALFFEQINFLDRLRIKNILYYAMYYSLFNGLSSNILLLPHLDLPQVNRLSHSRVFKDIDNYFVRKSIYGNDIVELLNRLRLSREAYSYYLPLAGTSNRRDRSLEFDQLFPQLCNELPIVYQVSNLLSYLSYLAWNKKVGELTDEYDRYPTECDSIFFSFLEMHDYLGQYCWIDDDDYYRQGYLLKNFKVPFPISWIITEKICEDLECAWEDAEGDQEVFNINNVGNFINSCIG